MENHYRSCVHWSACLCFTSDPVWWGEAKGPGLDDLQRSFQPQPFCESVTSAAGSPLHSRAPTKGKSQRVNSLLTYNACGGSNFASKPEWNSSLRNC